jgi:hypothetical protein
VCRRSHPPAARHAICGFHASERAWQT